MSKEPTAPHEDTIRYIKENYYVHQGIVYRIKDGYIGSINGDGHRQFKFTGTNGQITIAAHHMAWFFYYGEWPKYQIDHRDRNELDNGKENLREANNALNSINKTKNSNLPAGVKRKKRGDREYFEAYIRYRFKKMYIGSYDTAYEAGVAYRDKYWELYCCEPGGGEDLEIWG